MLAEFDQQLANTLAEIRSQGLYKTERIITSPQDAHIGVAGGRPGEVGRNWVERVDGTREEFGATCQVEMAAGDVFVIQTPGGGGFGK